MSAWSLRAAIRNMPLGLLPIGLFTAAYVFGRGPDEFEHLLILTVIGMSGAVGGAIGCLKPNGLLGAAVGAALAAGIGMLLFHTSKFPFADAGLFGGLVAVGELTGFACRAVFSRLGHQSAQ